MSAWPGCPGLPCSSLSSVSPKARASPRRRAAEDSAGCYSFCRLVSLRGPGVGSGPPPKTPSQAVLASGAPRPTLWVTLRVLRHPRPGQETRLTARGHCGWPGTGEFGAGARGDGVLVAGGAAAVSRAAQRCALAYHLSRGPGAPLCTAGLGRAPRPFSGFSCPNVPGPGLCATHKEGLMGRKGGGSRPCESPELWAVTGPIRHPHTTRPSDGGLVPLRL